MKLKNIFYSLCLIGYCGFTSTGLIAQKVPDPLVEGYIINQKKDTLRGYITLYNKIARQESIVFYIKNDVKTKTVYEATNLKIKGYGMEGKFYEPLEYKDSKSKNDKNFVERVIKGKLSLYTWYSLDPYTKGKPSYKPMEIIEDKDLVKEPLVRKGMYEIKNIVSMEFNNFKKAISEYLRENKSLAKDIEEKKYGKDDLMTIVNLYNSAKKGR